MDLDGEWSQGKEKKKKYLLTDSSVVMHNKLVRDNIPAIYEDSGKEVLTKELCEE